MKTNTNKNQKGLQSRAEQSNTATAVKVDFEKRYANRSLDTENVLALLRKEAAMFYQVAEVVGKWVWIQFTERQPREVTAALSQLGFHWNNKRQVWQHPCGTITGERATYDPRKRYGSHFPARATK